MSAYPRPAPQNPRPGPTARRLARYNQTPSDHRNALTAPPDGQQTGIKRGNRQAGRRHTPENSDSREAKGDGEAIRESPAGRVRLRTTWKSFSLLTCAIIRETLSE